MISFIASMVYLLAVANQVQYSCGQKITQKRPYGIVELRVECNYLEDKTDNNISVLEYKKDVQHGFQIDYDSTWRKRDSSFFLNGRRRAIPFFGTLLEMSLVEQPITMEIISVNGKVTSHQAIPPLSRIIIAQARRMDLGSSGGKMEIRKRNLLPRTAILFLEWNTIKTANHA